MNSKTKEARYEKLIAEMGTTIQLLLGWAGAVLMEVFKTFDSFWMQKGIHPADIYEWLNKPTGKSVLHNAVRLACKHIHTRYQFSRTAIPDVFQFHEFDIQSGEINTRNILAMVEASGNANPERKIVATRSFEVLYGGVTDNRPPDVMCLIKPKAFTFSADKFLLRMEREGVPCVVPVSRMVQMIADGVITPRSHGKYVNYFCFDKVLVHARFSEKHGVAPTWQIDVGYLPDRRHSFGDYDLIIIPQPELTTPIIPKMGRTNSPSGEEGEVVFAP